MSIWYRIRQGIGHLRPQLQRIEIPEDLSSLVKPGLADAWDQLGRADQEHLIQVARSLRERGASETLVAAGLLHDIGKAKPDRIVGAVPRTIHILTKRFPRIHSTARRFLPDLRILHEHPRLGAQMAMQFGYGERICELIERHEQRRHQDPELALLQSVDNRS